MTHNMHNSIIWLDRKKTVRNLGSLFKQSEPIYLEKSHAQKLK